MKKQGSILTKLVIPFYYIRIIDFVQIYKVIIKI